MVCPSLKQNWDMDHLKQEWDAATSNKPGAFKSGWEKWDAPASNNAGALQDCVRKWDAQPLFEKL